MMTSGVTLNGKHFVETHASGATRYTRRVFIDGKMVTRAVWIAEIKKAKEAEASGNKDASKRRD